MILFTSSDDDGQNIPTRLNITCTIPVKLKRIQSHY